MCSRNLYQLRKSCNKMIYNCVHVNYKGERISEGKFEVIGESVMYRLLRRVECGGEDSVIDRYLTGQQGGVADKIFLPKEGEVEDQNVKYWEDTIQIYLGDYPCPFLFEAVKK